MPALTISLTPEEEIDLDLVSDNPELIIELLPALQGDAGPAGTSVWGGLTGTLSNQTDLWAVLQAKEPTVVAGLSTEYYRGDKTWAALNKAAVGLGNVDNTSDVNKPVSSAQAAINALKADLVAGLVPVAQIPAIAITEHLGTVANEAAMLALVGQKGDWCIRSDLGKVYVITGNDPTLLADWTSLVYPASSVWGSITGTLSDQTDLWAELGLKALVANPFFTGGMSISGQSLTGSDATGLFTASTTWNTTGAPSIFDINLTDTASAANSNFIHMKVGGTTRFKISKGQASSKFESDIETLNGVTMQTLSMYSGSGIAAFGSSSANYPMGGKIYFKNGSYWTAVMDWTGFSGNPAIVLPSVGGLVWSSGAHNNMAYGAYDLALSRDAANTLAQRNSTNQQIFNIYQTRTDASNYIRLALGSSGGDFIIASQALGTGTHKQLHMKAQLHRFYVGSGAATPAWYINSDGSLTYEGNNDGGFIQLVEQNEPAAPGANKGRIFMQDNGAGKSKLMVRFPSGVSQQIAIEP